MAKGSPEIIAIPSSTPSSSGKSVAPTKKESNEEDCDLFGFIPHSIDFTRNEAPFNSVQKKSEDDDDIIFLPSSPSVIKYEMQSVKIKDEVVELEDDVDLSSSPSPERRGTFLVNTREESDKDGDTFLSSAHTPKVGNEAPPISTKNKSNEDQDVILLPSTYNKSKCVTSPVRNMGETQGAQEKHLLSSSHRRVLNKTTQETPVDPTTSQPQPLPTSPQTRFRQPLMDFTNTPTPSLSKGKEESNNAPKASITPKTITVTLSPKIQGKVKSGSVSKTSSTPQTTVVPPSSSALSSKEKEKPSNVPQAFIPSKTTLVTQTPATSMSKRKEPPSRVSKTSETTEIYVYPSPSLKQDTCVFLCSPQNTTNSSRYLRHAPVHQRSSVCQLPSPGAAAATYTRTPSKGCAHSSTLPTHSPPHQVTDQFVLKEPLRREAVTVSTPCMSDDHSPVTDSCFGCVTTNDNSAHCNNGRKAIVVNSNSQGAKKRRVDSSTCSKSDPYDFSLDSDSEDEFRPSQVTYKLGMSQKPRCESGSFGEYHYI